MSKKKDSSRDMKGEFAVRFKMDKIETLESGSCFIHQADHSDSPHPDSYAVCKEGKTVKIFKVVEE